MCKIREILHSEGPAVGDKNAPPNPEAPGPTVLNPTKRQPNAEAPQALGPALGPGAEGEDPKASGAADSDKDGLGNDGRRGPVGKSGMRLHSLA